MKCCGREVTSCALKHAFLCMTTCLTNGIRCFILTLWLWAACLCGAGLFLPAMKGSCAEDETRQRKLP